MIIKSLTGSFGKLRGETLELHPGLNVIEAPNESGKSTWCAFIQAMLYGVDSSAREKGGVLPAKVRYAPWSGAPMEGRMDIDWNGDAVTITRTTAQKSAPMRDFSAVYTGTGLPVPGLTGPSAGEQLTGASREVFRRTAFIGQGEIPVTGSPELEKRIGALVFSGDEDLSATAAGDTLRGWLRKRRKAMEQTEAELTRLRTAAGSGQALLEERAQVARQLELAEQTVENLRQESTDLRREQRQAALRRMSADKTRLSDLQKAAEAAAEAEHQAADALADSPFSGSGPAEARRRAETDLDSARRMERESRRSIPWAAWVTAALTVISIVLGIVWQPTAGFGAFFCGVLTVTLILQGRKNAAQARQKLANLLACYGVDSAPELEVLAADYEQLYRVWQAADQRLTAAKAALDGEYASRSGRDAEILSSLDFETGVNAAASAGRRLKQAEQLAAEYRTRLAKLDGRLETDAAVAGGQERIRELEAQKQRLEDQYEAILLSMRTLEAADQEIQRVFSPKLSARASEIMETFTGGRYDAVTLDRDLTAQARLAGDTVPRRTGYLSAGASDLLYLAVRLALCELVLPGGDCPVILDDSLANIDPVRRERVMAYLRQMAAARQVIVFSCTAV